jgi:hyperosmotically inducible periplasmic protein
LLIIRQKNKGRWSMKTRYAFKLIVPSVLFGMVLSVPSFAQESASKDMQQAGQEMKQAGSDTAAAMTDAYHGTERAVKDTAITAEIKTALARNKTVRSSEIHVDTVAGVVTLKGSVPSPEISGQAEQLAEQTNGVKSVNNQLMVVSSAQAD